MRPERVRVLSVLVTGLTVIGCTEVTEVDAVGTATVLVGVMVAGADSAFILLGRASSPGDFAPEPSADLALAHGGREIRLVEGPAGACGEPFAFTCYRAALDDAFEPGDSLRLDGRLGDGRRLSGGARVPPIPSISVDGAGPGDTVRLGSLQERQSVPGPEVLGLGDEPYRVDRADRTVDATVWLDGGSRTCPVTLPAPAGFDLRLPRRVGIGVAPPECEGTSPTAWDSMAVPYTVLAYDANFTAWTEAGLRLPAAAGGFGLQGVNGVLGAATPKTFIVLVTP